MVKVLIKKLSPTVQLPEYKTNGASGMDLMAFTEKPINLELLKAFKPKIKEFVYFINKEIFIYSYDSNFK